MHIAYLVQQFLPEVGAGPARVSELASRWRAAGAEVTIVTGMPNRPEGRIHPPYRNKLFVEEDWQGIRVLRSWLYASPKHGTVRTLANNVSFMTTAAAHALARVGTPDVLIASSPPFFPHVSGWAVARLRRVPLVLEIRDLWPDYLVDMGTLRRGGLPSRALFALERYLIRRADRTVVVTESFRRRVIEKGAAEGSVAVVPNGVDVDSYFASDECPPLEAMNRGGRGPVVGYLGNIGAGQDLGAVVRAAELVEQRDPGVTFVLAGDGPQARQVQSLARERRLGNLLLHGPIAKDRTRAFYNACDLCLVPLADVAVFQETVPSKLFEIMACERPVLASLGGEAAEIVRGSASGIVAAPGNPESIADGVLDLLARPEAERRDMGRRGRAYVTERYNRDVLASRYLELLRAVVGEPAGRHRAGVRVG
jgi:colanic acid biosynthesis glycosyl transferase WcaI